MILSAQSIRKYSLIGRPLVSPLNKATQDANGNSRGLSACGVDITIAQAVSLIRGDFVLASAIELFDLPDDVMGVVHDKSSLARRGLAVQNTVLEPGWKGYLTLELTMHSRSLSLPKGSAIAQVVFHRLDEPTELPYRGKYQNQAAGPQEARSKTVTLADLPHNQRPRGYRSDD